jgi:hypothetical protein
LRLKRLVISATVGCLVEKAPPGKARQVNNQIAAMTEVINFDTALKQIGADSCSILLGNGFSHDYCGYKTLLEKSGLPADAPCRRLFDRLDIRCHDPYRRS